MHLMKRLYVSMWQKIKYVPALFFSTVMYFITNQVVTTIFFTFFPPLVLTALIVLRKEREGFFDELWRVLRFVPCLASRELL